MMEHLPRMHEALDSIPSPEGGEEGRRKRRGRKRIEQEGRQRGGEGE